MDISLDNLLLVEDLIDYLSIAVHMDKYIDDRGNVIRYIKEIIEYYVEDDEIKKNHIYLSNGYIKEYFYLTKSLAEKIGMKERWYEDTI